MTPNGEPTTEARLRCTCTPPDGVSRNHDNGCPLFDVRAAYRQGREDEARATATPCARYWGSDGTLCATHNGRFPDGASNRCDRSEARATATPGLPNHPDDGHAHSWGCRRCGVDPSTWEMAEARATATPGLDELQWEREAASCERLDADMAREGNEVGATRWRYRGEAIRDMLAALTRARATATPGLREHPGEDHEFRTVCQTCGARGVLHVALITDDERVRIERTAPSDTPEERSS